MTIGRVMMTTVVASVTSVGGLAHLFYTQVFLLGPKFLVPLKKLSIAISFLLKHATLF